MNRTTAIILLAIIILVSFLAGMFSSLIFIKSYGGAGDITSNKQLDLTVKVVSSINLSGKVENISGKKITLSADSSSIIFEVDDTAQFFSVTPDSSGKTKLSQAKLSDVSVGKTIGVSTKLTSSGILRAYFINIF